MQTVRHLEYRHPEPLPDDENGEIRTPPALVESFLTEYTEPGDAVLDPFAGFGTTLRVATDHGRAAYGIEYESTRVEHIRDSVASATVFHGDARDVGAFDLPAIDCCFTSPPFMVAAMTDDPLRNYSGESDYERYLDGIRTVFEGVRDRLRPGGHAVIDVSNMKHEGRVTTLAWDIAATVEDVLHFEGEVVVVWDDSTEDGTTDRDGAFGYGYDHSYCLVFSNGD